MHAGLPPSVGSRSRIRNDSPQGALTVVNELAGAGLVVVEPAGRALMVSLNRAHLAAEPLMALVGSRARLVARLRGDLEGWQGLAGAWLFDSAARGDGGSTSDIDLLLVATRSIGNGGWGSVTAALIEQVTAWTGNAVQVVEYGRRTFAELVGGQNPLIEAIRTDGIPLTAKSTALLRRSA